MDNFRYIRMAGNDQGWRRPHSGRKGGDDYLGKQGLGHEDWNFAHDIWEDGRYHLYLKATPANFDKSSFNFVLGAHASPFPMIIGFVENATYGLSELPEQLLLRRAQEVFALNEDDSLGSAYGQRSVEEIATLLKQEASGYRVSVAPRNLHILAQPVPMPLAIYEVSHPGYRPLPMTEKQYGLLKGRVLKSDTMASVDQEEEASFPEGRLVERLHRFRERNRKVVEEAKRLFIETNGVLFCEACSLEPEKHFGSSKMRNRIIEAHHDVPLSDYKHEGKTKVSDLRMVCPTCHRAIHSVRPWLSVKELESLLKPNS
ncbi:HNH endonuclease [Loktanella salsilacus]|uniref:HNH endonuclease n=1 Tax=Loktanella salsilacus TaxID=195913 RepID=A0A1I4D4F5_9RHOB|nr:HNH endonuclease [Loktanella salsilacus]SFK88614.1 HNH endonuclease [Loktanella salsilacus]